MQRKASCESVTPLYSVVVAALISWGEEQGPGERGVQVQVRRVPPALSSERASSTTVQDCRQAGHSISPVTELCGVNEMEMSALAISIDTWRSGGVWY